MTHYRKVKFFYALALGTFITQKNPEVIASRAPTIEGMSLSCGRKASLVSHP